MNPSPSRHRIRLNRAWNVCLFHADLDSQPVPHNAGNEPQAFSLPLTSSGLATILSSIQSDRASSGVNTDSILFCRKFSTPTNLQSGQQVHLLLETTAAAIENVRLNQTILLDRDQPALLAYRFQIDSLLNADVRKNELHISFSSVPEPTSTESVVLLREVSLEIESASAE